MKSTTSSLRRSSRLPRWSRCDRAGWKADVKIWIATLATCPSRCRVPSRSRRWRSPAKFGLRYWPSVFRDVVFPSRSKCRRSLICWGLQVRCPALAKRTRCESGKIALSSTRCEAIGYLRPSMVKNCCPSNSSSAGRLRQEPSITKICFTTSSKLKTRAQVTREFPPSPQGRLRHQRPRSAGYDCVVNATVREGRV